jgi:hypothetical protein
MKEFLVANTDLSTEFEKISNKANTAAQHLRAANQHTRDQLAADVASAGDRATAAANQVKHSADGARDKSSSHWHDMRAKWQAHVAKVRASAKEKREQFDADAADTDANIALSYALDAIDFAQTAVDEAEYASLDAMSARADADSYHTLSRSD